MPKRPNHPCRPSKNLAPLRDSQSTRLRISYLKKFPSLFEYPTGYQHKRRFSFHIFEGDFKRKMFITQGKSSVHCALRSFSLNSVKWHTQKQDMYKTISHHFYFQRDKSSPAADIEGERLTYLEFHPYQMEAGLAKTKTFKNITPHQRRQQIIDILSQALAGQIKPRKKSKNTGKSSQKALA